MRGLDRWITGNYGEDQYRNFNEAAAELVGAKVWLTEEDAFGEITEYEDWEDADEDGRYGGTSFSVKFGQHVEQLEQGDLDDALAVTAQIDYWLAQA